jgi:hypothetical protein
MNNQAAVDASASTSDGGAGHATQAKRARPTDPGDKEGNVLWHLGEELRALGMDISTSGGYRGEGTASKSPYTVKLRKKVDDPSHEEWQRAHANHLSSVLLAHYGNDAVEFQVSIHRSNNCMLISSNKNSINKLVRNEIGSAPAPLSKLMWIARKVHTEVDTQAGLSTRDRPIVKRHAMKFLRDAGRFLPADMKVLVPKDDIDGKHAEQRMADTFKGMEGVIESFKTDEPIYSAPVGTSYPCGGCALYLDDMGVPTGNHIGKYYLSKPGLLHSIRAPNADIWNSSKFFVTSYRSSLRRRVTTREQLQPYSTARGAARGGGHLGKRLAESESD